MLLWNMLKAFFAPEGKYPPAGLPSVASVSYLAITVFIVGKSLKRHRWYTTNEFYPVVRKQLTVLWIMEIIKIVFRWCTGHFSDLNSWLPLYFCSITLFAGVMAGWGKGFVRRIGLVFMMTGGMVGGALFLTYPSSSILLFPAFHYQCVHSFVYHGCMVYLSALAYRTEAITLPASDFKWYALYTGFFCALALGLNLSLGTNLMFISKPFKGTFLDWVYQLLGEGFYTTVLILMHIFGPFWSMLLIRNKSHLLDPPMQQICSEPLA